jgi:omega-hydroxy-beta-dihydromenaquinone-9 sulfotransferase
MNWRERLLASVGPGLLGGITFHQWIHLLRQEHFAVDPARLPRALSITIQSLKNSAFHWYEQHHYGSLVEEVSIQPPLFILGHWRNGTTHLHQLLAQDRRFAFPNGYQAAFPHTFLTTEAMDSRMISHFVPKRRPMDNVEWTLASPQEDEFALCISCLKSPCMAWIFPRRRKHWGRYLSFRNASQNEIAEWRAAFELFLKKLTWKYRRPLVLKSPPHTCRVRLLLEMFPQAKFVHIHRDPYAVFQSTQKMLQTMLHWQGLQRPDLDELDDWILEQYREMYEVFFEERALIPPGCYHEMAFENLEKNPLGEMERLYEALDLPDFRVAQADVQRYTASVRNYRKNRFPALQPEIKARISSMWRTSFKEWVYA